MEYYNLSFIVASIDSLNEALGGYLVFHNDRSGVLF